MSKQSIAPILLTLSLFILLLPTTALSEKVRNMDDLLKKLGKAGLNAAAVKKEIQEGRKGINMSYQRSKQREISFEAPRDLFPISPKYFSVTFDAKIGLRGALASARAKASVVSMLFKRIQNNKINLISFLVWSGHQDLKEYKSIDIEKICKYYRVKGVRDCFPSKMAMTQTSGKDGNYFALSGDDIKSGTIKEEFIDELITRDYELENAKSEFYSRDHIDNISQRIEKLENILVGQEQAKKDTEDTLKNKLSKLDSKLAITGSLSERVKKMEQKLENIEKSVNRLADIFAGVSRKGNNIIFSKANVSIVNGTGQSEGKSNGLGNLIIGYNDSSKKKVDVSKTSHYLVIGGNDVVQGKNPHFGK